MRTAPAPAQPPGETLEGWYALHQIFRLSHDSRSVDVGTVASSVFGDHGEEGWSDAVRLIGSTSDVLLMHFRPTLDALGAVQRELGRQAWMSSLIPTYSFLSVAEAGMYHLTAQLVKEGAEQGWSVGDAAFRDALAERLDRQRQVPFVRKRLYPERPAGMPYVSFYPMSKRRAVDQNWYALPLEERSRLMHEHGLTGRRYAGKVSQIVTGAIGFDAWEWGVTLFAADPLDFKKLVSEMRFDEASAHYAEFGAFYVGRSGTLEEVLAK